MSDHVEARLRDGQPDALKDALTAIARERRNLDDLERRTVDAARRAGLTWSEIAAALGLKTRQAAEQRRLRLGPERGVAESRQSRRQLKTNDQQAGPRIARLRAAVAHVADTISLDAPDTHADLARLAQQTLRMAAEAPAGALVDLASMAAADLRSIPRTAAPGLAAALDALTSALAAARTPAQAADRGEASRPAR